MGLIELYKNNFVYSVENGIYPLILQLVQLVELKDEAALCSFKHEPLLNFF